MGRKEGGELKWRNNFPGWVVGCTAKHNGKYRYDRSFDRKLDAHGRWVVPITCPDHGEFYQKPAKHLGGQGCSLCAGSTLVDPLEKMRQAFPDQVFPDDWDHKSKDVFTLTCPKHGDFRVTYNQLMTRKVKGSGVACHKCAKEKYGLGKRMRPHEFLAKAHVVFPDYVFHMDGFEGVGKKVTYTCPDHGRKESVGSDILAGHGCPECGQEKRNIGINETLGVSKKQNVLDIGAAHGGRYIPHLNTINGTHQFISATCVDHGTFESRLYSLKAGHGCPKCSHRVSKAEIEIAAWLRSLGVQVDQQSRDILDQRGAVDIYLPDYDMAIEYCGLYWHQEKWVGASKHYARYKDATKGGTYLITIFEDEWEGRKEAVKGVLRGLLQLDVASIPARKTAVMPVPWSDVKTLYENTHLQGAGTPCQENYALFYQGDVVAAMSFKADRFGANTKELTRYAFNTRVVGGFSKLLAAFKRAQADRGTLVSYSDKRWFRGRTYDQAGFSYAGETRPGYWWCKGVNRYSRVRFQKHKLENILNVFDPNLTEEGNMIENKYWKVWDCGMDKWILTY